MKMEDPKITIKKLYEMAKVVGKEDAPVFIDYACKDDWYDYSGDISESDITFSNKGITISIINWE